MDVYRCLGDTVSEAVAAFRAGRLEKVTLDTACHAHCSGPRRDGAPH